MSERAPQEEDREDFPEDAADATEEARRRAAEDGRTLEDQADSLTVEDDGEVTP